jgi:hypothetical protein
MKQLLLAVVATCIAMGATAQKKSDAEKAVQFGAKAGITLANQTFTAEGISVSGSNKTGFTLGAVAKLNISRSFAIQPELNYTGLGSKSELFGESVKNSLTYITVPVLAKYTVANTGLSFAAGPQLGFLASAKAKADGESTNIKDSFKGTDFSGVAGIAYTFPMGLFVDARYQFGLSNIAKNKEDYDKVKNKAFVFSVGFYF